MANPIESSPARRLLGAALAWLALTGLAVAFVDLPAATWSHAHLRGIAVFPGLIHLVGPIVPAAAIRVPADSP